MKELKWRGGMTIEEKIDAGFKEVLRRFDSQEQEINGLRQFVSQKLLDISSETTISWISTRWLSMNYKELTYV